MMLKLTSKIIVWAICIFALAFIARPVFFYVYVYYNDVKKVSVANPKTTNDASKLNETKVDSIVAIPENKAAAIQQIAALIQRAAEYKQTITIAGAQHSMGGHTIYPNAIVLNMRGFRYVQYDSSQQILWTGSGTLWSEIIPYLDKLGKSVSVMQSNNSFSVGGSISVNCHGWQPDASPIASTVVSFRLITADGKLTTCSRTENKELFALVLGGYGLFGVITDVALKVVDNKMYTTQQYIIKSSDYVKEFNKYVSANPSIGLAYGRININPNHFMEEAILSTYQSNSSAPLKSVQENALKTFRRCVFRGSANSEYGKNLRWTIEKASTKLMNGRNFSRNQLSNEGVETFQNHDTAYTDILHEYFIPTHQVAAFIDSLKKIIPTYQVDLLNITLRNVKKDHDAFLAYANEEVFGFVMLFNQAKNPSSETAMRALTQRLVDVAIKLNGTYYLPYRLHATKQQMHLAYPKANAFFALKKKYDPNEIFKNKFYEAYQ